MFPAASPERAPAKPESTTDYPALAVVALYALLQVALTVIHHPWVDEAQAWLWATSLSNPVDFFIIPGEGHPPLWYWLLRALSSVLDFSQARYITLPVAIFNAWLLSRLLRSEFLLLVLMLGSFVVLQFWGYHFRPYSLIFTCLLSALLLERQGRSIAATWALAIACALHFFAGFLLALWLVWQWRKGTGLLGLLPPALFAACFGVLAILSGLGNPSVGPTNPDLLGGILYNMGWVGMAEPLRGPILAVVTIALLIYGLRGQPLLLAALLVLVLVLASGTALIYGKYPWHSAFQTMLCFLAFMLAGINTERRWIMALLLAPQVVYGIDGVMYRFAHPKWAGDDLYAVVLADAGADFRPETDLVVWPDLAGPTIAASNDIQVLSGNTGALLGPITWRSFDQQAMAPLLLEKPAPYWLVCAICAPVIAHLEANDRTLTQLGTHFIADNGMFYAYRVE